MNPDLERRVIELVSAYTATKAEKLTLDTTLFGDLGVDGDDGLELMQAFGTAFEVDLSEFEFSRHFGPEGTALPPLFFIQIFRQLILGEDSHEIGGVTPITIEDLVEAAERKRWAR